MRFNSSVTISTERALAAKQLAFFGGLISVAFVAFFYFLGLASCAAFLAILYTVPFSVSYWLLRKNVPRAPEIFFGFIFTSSVIHHFFTEPGYIADLFFFPLSVIGVYLVLPDKKAFKYSLFGAFGLVAAVFIPIAFPSFPVLFTKAQEGLTFFMVFAGVTVFISLLFALNMLRYRRLAVMLQEKAEDLQNLSEDYLNLIRVLTHDFSNQVMVASLATERLTDTLASNGIPNHTSVVSIENALRHIRQMISKLRELKRVCGTVVTVLPVFETPLGDVLERTELVFAKHLEQKQVKIRISGPIELVRLKTDPLLFSAHIFSNLIDNAIKFSPPKSEIFINAEAIEGGKARLRIENYVANASECTGLGIGLRIATRFCRKLGIRMEAKMISDLSPRYSVILIVPMAATTRQSESRSTESHSHLA
jgi:signal transduction histidine kinase